MLCLPVTPVHLPPTKMVDLLPLFLSRDASLKPFDRLEREGEIEKGRAKGERGREGGRREGEGGNKRRD